MNNIELDYNNLLLLSGRITTLLSVIPIFVAIWQRKKLSKPLQIFFWFGVVRFALNLILEAFIWSITPFREFWTPILKEYKIENTLFFNIVFYLANYIILGILFKELLKKSIFQSILKYFIPFISIAAVFIFFFIDGYHGFGTVGPIINGLYICVLPLVYLWYLFQNDTQTSVSQKPYFWISLGLAIPHLIDLLFLFTADKLYDQNFVLYCKTHIIRNILEIFAQLLFAFAFFIARQEKSNKSNSPYNNNTNN